MIAAVGSFADGWLKGMQIANESQKIGRERKLHSDLAGVDENFTPTQTEVASGVEALTAAQQAKENALATAADDVQRQQVETNFAPTINALEARKDTPAAIAHSVGIGRDFQQQAEPFDPNQIANAKTQARAGIYSRHGREDDAARVMQNEQRRRAMADDAELRRVLDPGAPTGTPGGLAMDFADVTASDTIPGITKVIRAQGVDEPVQREKDGEASKAYYERKAPVIIDTLLKQGNLEGAKRYRDFVDSEKGRAYTEKWSRGVRKFAIGDHQGALSDWEQLYNSQLYDDGNTVKLQALDDGKQVRVDQFGKDGKQILTRTMPINDLAYQAGLALAPEKLVEMRARQEEKRQQEAASLDKSIQLETLRQQGQESREDRRDARLVKQIEAANTRAANRPAGGLTQAQIRSNFEIDAAREMVTGLSDDDIRQRTTPTTATGRENPLFDPALARAAKLASRRKIGDDEDFDARTGRQLEQPAASTQPAAAKPAGTPIERAKAAMAADPNMAGYTLGAQTMKGFKVIDKDGRHVGYYGAAR